MPTITVKRADDKGPRWGCGCMAFRSAYGNFPKDLVALAERAEQVEVKTIRVENNKVVFGVLSGDHEYTVILDPAGTPQVGWCKHIEKCAEVLILPVAIGR